MFAGAVFTDNADIQAVDAVNMLTALGVIDGFEDGSFKPDGTVTRAQMAKMIFVVRNNKVDDAAYKNNSTKFTDINDNWAAGYIKFCESQGIIAGKSETLFKPNDTVTGVEAAKMLLVLAGYDPDKAGLTGPDWRTNTLRWAGGAGLFDGVNSSLEEGLPRQYAAQVIYNALDANRVKWSDDNNSFDDILNGGVKETVGRAYMGLYRTAGVLVSVEGNEITLANADGAESDATSYDSKSEKYKYETNFTKVDTDYSDLLGQKVKVMFKDAKTNSVLGVYPLSDNTAITVNANEIEADGEKVKFGGKSYGVENDYGKNYIDVYYTSVDGKMTEFVGEDGTENKDLTTFTTEAGVTYGLSGKQYDSDEKDDKGNTVVNGYKANQPIPDNGYTKRGFYTNVESPAQSIFDNWDSSAAIMTFVDSNANGKFNAVIITDYKAAEVTSVSSSKLVAGKSYNFDEENIDEGFAKDDWAIISWDRFNDCQRIQKADVVTEKLNGLRKDSESDDYVIYDKKNNYYYGVKYNEYQIGDSWYNGVDGGVSTSDINTVQAGDTVEAVIVNGVVYKIKRTTEGSLSDVTNVAMVVNKEEGIGGKQVKLQFFNDTTRVVDVDSDSQIPYATTYKDATKTQVDKYGLEVGKLYEYSISGGEYSFEYLDKTPDYYGEYSYKAGISDIKTATTTNPTDGDGPDYSWATNENGTNPSTINGTTIDDKAKVILFKQTYPNDPEKKESYNESKVITGKQLKALAAADAFESSTITAEKAKSEDVDWFTADISGLTRAAALALHVEIIPGTLRSNDYYGYIMDDASQSGSNEVQYKLLVQGTDEIITVYEKNVDYRQRKKNQLIGYKTLDSADADKRYIDDVFRYTRGTPHFGLSAITSTNSNKSKIQIADVKGDLEVNADTVLFFINTDDMTGTSADSASSISKAHVWYDKADTIQVWDAGTCYAANCLYLADNDELEVLVVENGDGCFRGPYTSDVSVSASNQTAMVSATSRNITVNTKGIADDAVVEITDSDGNLLGKEYVNSGSATIYANISSLAKKQGEYTLTVTVYTNYDIDEATPADRTKIVDTFILLTVGEQKTEMPAEDVKAVNDNLSQLGSGKTLAITGKVSSDTYETGAATLVLGASSTKPAELGTSTTVKGDVKLDASNVTVPPSGATLNATTATVVGKLPDNLTLNVTDTLTAENADIASLANVKAKNLEAKTVTVDATNAKNVTGQIEATDSITVEQGALATAPNMKADTITVADTVTSKDINDKKIVADELIASVDVTAGSEVNLASTEVVGQIDVSGTATLGDVSATATRAAGDKVPGTVNVKLGGKAIFTKGIDMSKVTGVVAEGNTNASIVFQSVKPSIPADKAGKLFAHKNAAEGANNYVFVDEPTLSTSTEVVYTWATVDIADAAEKATCWISTETADAPAPDAPGFAATTVKLVSTESSNTATFTLNEDAASAFVYDSETAEEVVTGITPAIASKTLTLTFTGNAVPTTNKKYYISVKKTADSTESERTEVTVQVVTAAPEFDESDGNTSALKTGEGAGAKPTAEFKLKEAASDTTFQIYSATGSGQALAQGTKVDGATVTAGGQDNKTLTVTFPADPFGQNDTSLTYFITATKTGCEESTGTQVTVNKAATETPSENGGGEEQQVAE